jgi:hypothetical protein
MRLTDSIRKEFVELPVLERHDDIDGIILSERINDSSRGSWLGYVLIGSLVAWSVLIWWVVA